MSLGVKHNRYYTAKREGYVFDYVKQYLIDKYGLDTVRRGGLRVDTTIDLHLQKLARKALDGNLGAPDRAGAIVTIDPAHGLRAGDGLVVALRRLEVQPRRAGPPPGGLDVQGHGPHGRAAARRGPQPHELRLAPAAARLAADRARLRGPHLRADLRRLDEPRHGDAEVRQHGLRAARRRPRPRHGGPDRARHGHHEPAARLSGRGPGRPDQRRLAAGDGARLRDDRQRRLPREADRRAQGHLPRRPRRRPGQADQDQGLRGRRDLRGHADPREERAGRHRDQGRRSAARRPARPARWTTSPTPGSSASPRGWSPRSGSATRRTPIPWVPTRRAARSPRRSGART